MDFNFGVVGNDATKHGRLNRLSETISYHAICLMRTTWW